MRTPKPLDPARARRIEARFRAKYVQLGPDECWLWTAATCGRPGSERGIIDLGGHDLQIAPRVAWALDTDEDPGALWVLHSCDNGLCVNPAHLFLGTPKQNTEDMLEKGRHRTNPLRRDGTPKRSKVSEATVRAIRLEYKPRSGETGSSLEEVAKRHKISERQVWMIATRRSWAHVE